jgi:DNA-directed RNA polymerase I, II, and III subunit RPABC2
MAESEDKKLNLKKIFMTSNMRTGSSTIQNGGKKNQNLDSEIANGKLASGSDTDDDDSESSSDSDSEVSESVIDSDVEQNSDLEDEFGKPEEDEVSVSEEEEAADSEETKNDEVADTEYNEDGVNEKDTEKDTDKDTEMNNDEDDDCLYQYDDLVEERDSERQVYEIPRAERMTDPQLTHYEKVRILGIRAKQIAMGSKVMVKYDNSFGPVELAKYELKHKTTPLVIKRPLPDNTYEIWKVSDLNIDDDDSNMIKQDLESSFVALNHNHLYMIG